MKQSRLTFTGLAEIPMIQQGDDLAAIIVKSVRQSRLSLKDGDVLVVAQKIVSKAEGRMVNLKEVTPSPQAIELAEQSGKDARSCEVLLWDTREIIRVRPGVIIVETNHGWVCANAGIDRSNVGPYDEGWVLRLPEDADLSASRLRARLLELTGRDIAIVINDTHGRAWRNGAVGVAIGVSGVPALDDLRGQPDLFGNEMQSTVVGLADELASAASLLQGQTNEGVPVVHMRGLRRRTESGSAREIVRPKEQDLFR